MAFKALLFPNQYGCTHGIVLCPIQWITSKCYFHSFTKQRGTKRELLIWFTVQDSIQTINMSFRKIQKYFSVATADMQMLPCF